MDGGEDNQGSEMKRNSINTARMMRHTTDRSPVLLTSVTLLLVAALGCSESVDPEGTLLLPGVGSSYRVVERYHDDNPATPDYTDTLVYTVAAQIDSYQGMLNVTQFNGPENSIFYGVYHQSDNFSRYYPSNYFPSDGYQLPPLWATFPYGESGRNEVLLLDTVDGNRHVTYRVVTERKGGEKVEIGGQELDGWRLDYSFILDIEEEEVTTTIGGRTLYVPSIGWSAWTEETTERQQEGEVTMQKTKRSELVEYAVSS